MIEVKNLTKRYGAVTAVSDLSFTVPDGGVYGLLGPNGAGKTTTINIITGCLAQTEGSVTVNGMDVFEGAGQVKRLMGYLPEIPPVYPDMTPGEFLGFVAEARGIKKTGIPAAVADVCGDTGIWDVRDRLIKNLSKGYRQRVGIAQALVGDPRIIILDEPTAGLDPKQIAETRGLIRKLGQSHTVILSSHILSEVQALCDTILIISKGTLAACDTAENLERLFSGTPTVKITAKCTREEAETALRQVPGIIKLTTEDAGGGITLITAQTENSVNAAEAAFFAFNRLGKPITGMESSKATLEDVFLELTADRPVDPNAENNGGTEGGGQS